MKKILLALLLSLIFANDTLAMSDAQEQAQHIYNQCSNQIQMSQEDKVISGNMADVKRIRQIRHCLKKNIINIAATVLQKNELSNFEQAVEANERTIFNIYKLLFFCNLNMSEDWCKRRVYDDMSLEKLMLERELEGHTYNLLIKVLETQKGG